MMMWRRSKQLEVEQVYSRILILKTVRSKHAFWKMRTAPRDMAEDTSSWLTTWYLRLLLPDSRDTRKNSVFSVPMGLWACPKRMLWWCRSRCRNILISWYSGWSLGCLSSSCSWLLWSWPRRSWNRSKAQNGKDFIWKKNSSELKIQKSKFSDEILWLEKKIG